MSQPFDSFDYHTPTPEQLDELDLLRRCAKDFRTQIQGLPTSREQSLALTNLEQALSWAGKAVFVPAKPSA